MSHLIKFTDKGFYCEKAGVYIDPWKKVDRAIITHAHSDHARYGNKHYLCHSDSVNLLKHRLSKNISVQGLAYGDTVYMNGVTISLFPAGHIHGSAQVLIKDDRESWVISGDYNLQEDSHIPSFQSVKCDHFVTESTFGLPVFRWDDPLRVFEQINAWWQSNADQGIPSVISAYSLGKAQRIIQNVDHNIGPVMTHAAVEGINEALRSSGISIKKTEELKEFKSGDHNRALIICPPGATDSNWHKKIKNAKTAFASGWMMLRGAKRRRGIEKAFILSDHCDWEGLNHAIDATGAPNVYVTHGYTSVFTKWLREKSLNAHVVSTKFEGESIEVQNNES